jgi:hypothetical protein
MMTFKDLPIEAVESLIQQLEDDPDIFDVVHGDAQTLQPMHLESLPNIPFPTSDSEGETLGSQDTDLVSTSDESDSLYSPSECSTSAPSSPSSVETTSSAEEREFGTPGAGLAVMVHCDGPLTDEKTLACAEIQEEICHLVQDWFTLTDATNDLVFFYHGQTNQMVFQVMVDSIIQGHYPGYEARVRYMTASDSLRYNGWDDWFHPIWSTEPVREPGPPRCSPRLAEDK